MNVKEGREKGRWRKEGRKEERQKDRNKGKKEGRKEIPWDTPPHGGLNELHIPNPNGKFQYKSFSQ